MRRVTVLFAALAVASVVHAASVAPPSAGPFEPWERFKHAGRIVLSDARFPRDTIYVSQFYGLCGTSGLTAGCGGALSRNSEEDWRGAITGTRCVIAGKYTTASFPVCCGGSYPDSSGLCVEGIGGTVCTTEITDSHTAPLAVTPCASHLQCVPPPDTQKPYSRCGLYLGDTCDVLFDECTFETYCSVDTLTCEPRSPELYDIGTDCDDEAGILDTPPNLPVGCATTKAQNSIGLSPLRYMYSRRFNGEPCHTLEDTSTPVRDGAPLWMLPMMTDFQDANANDRWIATSNVHNHYCYSSDPTIPAVCNATTHICESPTVRPVLLSAGLACSSNSVCLSDQCVGNVCQPFYVARGEQCDGRNIVCVVGLGLACGGGEGDGPMTCLTAGGETCSLNGECATGNCITTLGVCSGNVATGELLTQEWEQCIAPATLQTTGPLINRCTNDLAHGDVCSTTSTTDVCNDVNDVCSAQTGTCAFVTGTPCPQGDTDCSDAACTPVQGTPTCTTTIGKSCSDGAECTSMLCDPSTNLCATQVVSFGQRCRSPDLTCDLVATPNVLCAQSAASTTGYNYCVHVFPDECALDQECVNGDCLDGTICSLHRQITQTCNVYGHVCTPPGTCQPPGSEYAGTCVQELAHKEPCVQASNRGVCNPSDSVCSPNTNTCLYVDGIACALDSDCGSNLCYSGLCATSVGLPCSDAGVFCASGNCTNDVCVEQFSSVIHTECDDLNVKCATPLACSVDDRTCRFIDGTHGCSEDTQCISSYCDSVDGICKATRTFGESCDPTNNEVCVDYTNANAPIGCLPEGFCGTAAEHLETCMPGISVCVTHDTCSTVTSKCVTTLNHACTSSPDCESEWCRPDNGLCGLETPPGSPCPTQDYDCRGGSVCQASDAVCRIERQHLQGCALDGTTVCVDGGDSCSTTLGGGDGLLTCVGTILATCTIDQDCASAYCSGNVCANRIPAGGSCVAAEDSCDSDLLCVVGVCRIPTAHKDPCVNLSTCVETFDICSGDGYGSCLSALNTSCIDTTDCIDTCGWHDGRMVCETAIIAGQLCTEPLTHCVGGSVCDLGDSNICRVPTAHGDLCAPYSRCNNFPIDNCSGPVPERCLTDIGFPCPVGDADCSLDTCVDGGCRLPIQLGAHCVDIDHAFCVDGGICDATGSETCRFPTPHRAECVEHSICVETYDSCTGSPPATCLTEAGAVCTSNDDCALATCDGATCRIPVAPGGSCADPLSLCVDQSLCQQDQICRVPILPGGVCSNRNTTYCSDTRTSCGYNGKDAIAAQDPTANICVYSLGDVCRENITDDGHCDSDREVCDPSNRCLRKVDHVCDTTDDCAQYDFCLYKHRGCEVGESRPTACRANGFTDPLTGNLRKVCMTLPAWLGRWCDPACPADNDCETCLSPENSTILDEFTNCTERGILLAAAQAEAEAAAAAGSARRLLEHDDVPHGVLYSSNGGECTNSALHCLPHLQCYGYKEPSRGVDGHEGTCISPFEVGVPCRVTVGCSFNLSCDADTLKCVDLSDTPNLAGAVCDPDVGCGNNLACEPTTNKCVDHLDTPNNVNDACVPSVGCGNNLACDPITKMCVNHLDTPNNIGDDCVQSVGCGNNLACRPTTPTEGICTNHLDTPNTVGETCMPDVGCGGNLRCDPTATPPSCVAALIPVSTQGAACVVSLGCGDTLVCVATSVGSAEGTCEAVYDISNACTNPNILSQLTIDPLTESFLAVVANSAVATECVQNTAPGGRCASACQNTACMDGEVCFSGTCEACVRTDYMCRGSMKCCGTLDDAPIAGQPGTMEICEANGMEYNSIIGLCLQPRGTYAGLPCHLFDEQDKLLWFEEEEYNRLVCGHDTYCKSMGTIADEIKIQTIVPAIDIFGVSTIAKDFGYCLPRGSAVQLGVSAPGNNVCLTPTVDRSLDPLYTICSYPIHVGDVCSTSSDSMTHCEGETAFCSDQGVCVAGPPTPEEIAACGTNLEMFTNLLTAGNGGCDGGGAPCVYGARTDQCETNNQCDDPLVCTDGKCADFVPVICDVPVNVDGNCGATNTCLFPYTCIGGKCVDLQPATGACGTNNLLCDGGLVCRDEKCVAPAQLTDDCIDDSYCEGSLYCISGKCASAATKGQPCSTSTRPCAANLACRGPVGATTCMLPLALGDTCLTLDDQFCDSDLVCDEGLKKCVGYKGFKTCGVDDDCDSLHCDDGVCRARPKFDNCTVTEDCAGTLVCRASRDPLEPQFLRCLDPRLYLDIYADCTNDVHGCGGGLDCASLPAGGPVVCRPKVMPALTTQNCTDGDDTTCVGGNICSGSVCTLPGIPAGSVCNLADGHYCSAGNSCYGGVCVQLLPSQSTCVVGTSVCDSGLICREVVATDGNGLSVRKDTSVGLDSDTGTDTDTDTGTNTDGGLDTGSDNVPVTKCLPPLVTVDYGQDCDYQFQCSCGLLCRPPAFVAGGLPVQNQCLPAKVLENEGGTCDANSDCVGGLLCNTADRACFVPLPLDTPCVQSYQCNHDASIDCLRAPLAASVDDAVDASTPLLCRLVSPPRLLGWSCNGNSACTGGLVCENNTCIGAKSFASCTLDTDCASGHCLDSGVCEQKQKHVDCAFSEECDGDLVCRGPDTNPAAKIGQTCQDAFVALPYGSVCTSQVQCGQNSGLVCDTLPLAGGGFTDETFCRIPVVPMLLGHDCANNTVCSGGLVCNSTDKCVGAKTFTQCKAGSDCASGHCLDSGVCEQKLKGIRCGESEECDADLVCRKIIPAVAHKTCEDPKINLGLDVTCEANHDCAVSLVCIGSPIADRDGERTVELTCRPPAVPFPVGWKCPQGESQCQGGLVCRKVQDEAGVETGDDTCLAPVVSIVTGETCGIDTVCEGGRVCRFVQDINGANVGDSRKCLEPIVSTATGVVCGVDSICEGGRVCRFEQDINGEDVGATKKCLAPIVSTATGQPCGVDSICEGGRVCRAEIDANGDSVGTLFCLPPPIASALGSVCSVSNTCAGGLACIGGHCDACAHAGLSEGSACDANADCQYGTECKLNICTALAMKIPIGGSCTASDQCEYGVKCKKSICRAPRGVGEPCGDDDKHSYKGKGKGHGKHDDKDDDCSGKLICVANMCAIAPKALPFNAPCNSTEGDTCAHGYECDNGNDDDETSQEFCLAAYAPPHCHYDETALYQPFGGARGRLLKSRRHKHGHNNRHLLSTPGVNDPSLASVHAVSIYEDGIGWQNVTNDAARALVGQYIAAHEHTHVDEKHTARSDEVVVKDWAVGLLPVAGFVLAILCLAACFVPWYSNLGADGLPLKVKNEDIVMTEVGSTRTRGNNVYSRIPTPQDTAAY